MKDDIDLDNIGFKEIRFRGKTIQPDGHSSTRDYVGIVYVGENEDGTPRENYIDFKELSINHKLGDPVPIPKVQDDFTGWTDSSGTEIGI
jgi:hypothetical protein